MLYVLYRSESESAAELNAEHKRLVCSDALRLIAVEIVSDTRIDICSEMLAEEKFHSDAEIGGCLESFYAFFVQDVFGKYAIFIRNAFLVSSSSVCIEVHESVFHDIIVCVYRNTDIVLCVADV